MIEKKEKEKLLYDLKVKEIDAFQQGHIYLPHKIGAGL